MTDEAKRLEDWLNAYIKTESCHKVHMSDMVFGDYGYDWMWLDDICKQSIDLIEALSAELEQVKQERDGLSIMLTSAISAAHTFKRKLEEVGHKDARISPLVLGRMNGRHDGYNVLFSAIDEMPEKPCDTCVNRNWDMPQCRVCNSTNDFRWYVKEG